MIAVFVNQKGGAGKITVAIHPSGGPAHRGLRTALVDTDLKGSALHWTSIACQDTV